VVGMAERYWKELRPSQAGRYWKELRPSQAGRFRLDAGIRPTREQAERDLRRPRPHARPKLRTTPR
jgi:hypothetical protein